MRVIEETELYNLSVAESRFSRQYNWYHIISLKFMGDGGNIAQILVASA